MQKLAACPLFAAASLLLLPPPPAARAEPGVTIEHNDAAAASEGYRFKTIFAPTPSAASSAVFKVIDGAGDPNGGSPDVLHDGKGAGDEDEPASNFFFEAGSDGGRLLVDLGKVIAIKEIDTYSWHSGARAPQVYKVYGSDGAGSAFQAAPRRPQDPALAGWKLVAAVDTRPKFGDAGGQYAVRIADPAGNTGSYRYLLFDISQTTTVNPFGDTFYSEIDVIDRDGPPRVASAPTKETTKYNEKGLQLIYTSDDPTFDPKERDRLVQTFFKVYPLMTEAFNKNAPTSVKISIEKKYRGVAATAGNVIHCNPAWFRRNPEDIDVITHEGMHVVQQYRDWDPAWLREGLADYARFKFGVNNPKANWTLPEYDAQQSYTDAYRVTARFLLWLEKRVKPGIATTFDGMMREGTYRPETWKQLTGKTVDELWQDYGKNPAL